MRSKFFTGLSGLILTLGSLILTADCAVASEPNCAPNSTDVDLNGDGCGVSEEHLVLITLLYHQRHSAGGGGRARLNYERDAISYAVGTPIGSNRAQLFGAAAVNYEVFPEFPAGLTLDPANGNINGTPTTPTEPGFHTVRAETTAGPLEKIVKIGVAANSASITCNKNGIAPGCTADMPFSCPNEPYWCFASGYECRLDAHCNFYF